MRCERCGVEIEAGSMCDACAEGAPPVRRSVFGHTVSVITGLIFIGGFLLVVGTMIFPTCGCRHGRAKQTKSLNNIKQLALAVMQYSQDYNETFPGWVKNPDGRYVHNVWDQQIDTQVKSKDSYSNGDTGIRSYADPARSRVLTYGLNGLLIAPADDANNANFDVSNNTKVEPQLLSPSAVANPSGTILFAELATKTRMPGVYGTAPSPLAATSSPTADASSQWRGASDGWIDINPRAFVEVLGPGVAGNYEGFPTTYQGNGVARDLYGGGGSYAFADGHAKFMKLSQSVGIGTEVNGRKVTPENCWEAWNKNNMWIPQ